MKKLNFDDRDGAIYSQREIDHLRALYHTALSKLHAAKIELARRETHNLTETRKTKRLPTARLSSRIESAREDVAAAKRAFAPHNVADYAYSRSSLRQPRAFDEDAEYASGVMFPTVLLDIKDQKFLSQRTWEPWPIATQCVEYTSVMKGIGDGEQRVAHLFGGSIMGGNKSYDLIIRGAGRWEVKDLSNGNEIRPGTQGTRFY